MILVDTHKLAQFSDTLKTMADGVELYTGLPNNDAISKTYKHTKIVYDLHDALQKDITNSSQGKFTN